MAQQTAVEWLVEQMFKAKLIPSDTHPNNILFSKAKQMEKEQISKAWDDGNYQYFCSVRTNEDFNNGYEYYEEQYKSE